MTQERAGVKDLFGYHRGAVPALPVVDAGMAGHEQRNEARLWIVLAVLHHASVRPRARVREAAVEIGPHSAGWKPAIHAPPKAVVRREAGRTGNAESPRETLRDKVWEGGSRVAGIRLVDGSDCSAIEE